MSEYILEVDKLKKTYKMGETTVHALSNISFEIKQGEFVVILGPSGSGKSTLLNIIGGMDKGDTGRVRVKDHLVSDMNDVQLTGFRRNDIGFVFQFYNLMGNLTARENVEIASEICSDPMDIDEIIDEVGLKDRADHFPSQLSGGEQQRVAIARAVAKNPSVLLCDEPTGALDYTTGITILSLLSRINKEYNKTIIVITHNAPIADMADRVIKLRSGRIVENRINTEPISPEGIEW